MGDLRFFSGALLFAQAKANGSVVFERPQKWLVSFWFPGYHPKKNRALRKPQKKEPETASSCSLALLSAASASCRVLTWRIRKERRQRRDDSIGTQLRAAQSQHRAASSPGADKLLVAAFARVRRGCPKHAEWLGTRGMSSPQENSTGASVCSFDAVKSSPMQRLYHHKWSEPLLNVQPLAGKMETQPLTQLKPKKRKGTLWLGTTRGVQFDFRTIEGRISFWPRRQALPRPAARRPLEQTPRCEVRTPRSDGAYGRTKWKPASLGFPHVAVAQRTGTKMEPW